MDDKYREALIDLLNECFFVNGEGRLEWSYIEGVSLDENVRPETLATIKDLYREG